MDASQAYIRNVITRTLGFLGLEPEDVEVSFENPTYGGTLALVHWSAQTVIGDTTGTIPVPYFEKLDSVAIRRAAAEQALRRLRVWEASQEGGPWA